MACALEGESGLRDSFDPSELDWVCPDIPFRKVSTSEMPCYPPIADSEAAAEDDSDAETDADSFNSRGSSGFFLRFSISPNEKPKAGRVKIMANTVVKSGIFIAL